VKLQFALEPLKPIWGDILRLASEHWSETEGYRHGQVFAPDAYRYFQYNDIGFYLMFTARDEGRMVGYAGMYVTPSMHTQQIIATEDTWFLLPDYRKGRNALAFHRFVEDEMQRRGVVEIGMTAKLTNHAGKILEYLGYKPVSLQYSKHLKSSTIEASPQSGTALSQGCADSAITEPVMEFEHVRTVAACTA